MPRNLSTDLQTQVSSTATKTAFLVELNLSTTIRLTDWYSNVTYDSNSYEAGGSFLSVDSITETGQLEVNEITIGFSNITLLNLGQSSLARAFSISSFTLSFDSKKPISSSNSIIIMEKFSCEEDSIFIILLIDFNLSSSGSVISFSTSSDVFPG